MRRCSFSSRSLRSVMSYRPAEAHGPALGPGAFEIGEPQGLHPADLAVCPPEPELGGGALRIAGIERCLDGCQDLFHVVRMHPLHDLLDSRLTFGKVEDFLSARIPAEHAVARIVLPRPELGCVEGKLETVFTRFHVLLRSLARLEVLDHGHVAQWPAKRITDDIDRRLRPA